MNVDKRKKEKKDRSWLQTVLAQEIRKVFKSRHNHTFMSHLVQRCQIPLHIHNLLVTSAFLESSSLLGPYAVGHRSHDRTSISAK